MKTVRAKQAGDWKDGFLFLGNHPALDFLNTRPVMHQEPVELLPDFKALLRWFQAAGLLTAGQATGLQSQWGDSARARRIVDQIRQLREKLRKQVIEWESGKAIGSATVAELNRLMRDHPMLSRLLKAGDRPAAELWFDPRQPEDLLAPLAHSAAMLFASVDRNRVRQCANCVLHFEDTSKKGTRRWCSMNFCGNRAKVAAYAARQRGLR